MKVFVAGATGVLGRVLIPLLVARGDEVVGMTRSALKEDLVRGLGARPVVAYALDPGREPLVASADDDPVRKAEMADSLSLAFHVLLESLSPEQRAAFLLHEVFDEPYDRIAEIITTNAQNARQLVTRARRQVEEQRPRFEASREKQEQLATRFFAAAELGDLAALEELLAHDVVLHGRARVARTLIAGLRRATRTIGFTLRREVVNGQPGALFFEPEGKVAGVMILDVANGQIQGVNSIVNPDKLRHLGPVTDLRALLSERS